MDLPDSRIVFMGTPDFAIAPLEAIINSGFTVAGIVTAPDKPSGRGKKINVSPVKKYHAERNLECPLMQPVKLKDPVFIEQLKKLKADVFVVVAFRMLPEAVWSIPPKGTFNLHASLLPDYRGAAPINWAIINGETETGVTTFLIDHEIDTGKILLQKKIGILPKDNAGSLHDKLMIEGATLTADTLKGLVLGKTKPTEQSQLIEDKPLKKAPKINKEDCRIDWNDASEKIHNMVRGMSPYPSAFAMLKNQEGEEIQLKIFETVVPDIQRKGNPGAIVSDNKKILGVYTGDGQIGIKSLQMAGKKRMSTADFLHGFHDDINHYSLH